MLRARADNSTENERELEWTEFNKPSKITRNGKTVEFYYDANHNRYLKKNSDGIETFYFGKTYERVTDTNTGIVQHKHFIYADGKLIALNTQTKEADNSLKDKQVRYLHYDALNSVDMITDGYGLVVERRSYDTWGKKRNVLWREDGPLDVVQAAITNRGYTGHEEIVEVDLVHMNGRVYDQELGRFISPDPIIQAPYVTNSFNRYAYVMNNPLKYTDPTGYFWEGGSCNTDGTMRDRGGRVTGRWDRDRDRNRNTPATPPRNTPATPPRTKPKVKEEEVPKVEPTVSPKEEKPASIWDKIDDFVKAQARNLDPDVEMALRVAGSYYNTGTVDGVIESLNAEEQTAYSSAIQKGTAMASVVVGLSKGKVKTYQTYTKTNPITGETYTGRTSGYGTPHQNVARRDANHHMDDSGFGPAELDVSSKNKAAIRGREQQQIELFGGAKSQGGTSGNAINGIADSNPKGGYYRDEAIKEFGEL